MNPNPPEIRKGVVAPVECLKEGWALIKDQYWLFLGIVFVGAFVGGAVPVIIFGAMMCGIYLCLFAKMRGEPVEFGLLFKGFDHFVPGLVAAALHVIPFVIVMLPLYVIMFAILISTSSGGRTNQDEFVTALLAFYFIFILAMLLVALLVGVFFMFPYALIVDRKLSGLEAVKTSIKAGAANFGGVLGLLLLNMCLVFVGVLACYVGAFLTMPIAFASYAVAYRKVFGEGPLSAAPPPPPASWAA
jgi:uncharacterized membrane protein